MFEKIKTLVNKKSVSLLNLQTSYVLELRTLLNNNLRRKANWVGHNVRTRHADDAT